MFYPLTYATPKDEMLTKTLQKEICIWRHIILDDVIFSKFLAKTRKSKNTWKILFSHATLTSLIVKKSSERVLSIQMSWLFTSMF